MSFTNPSFDFPFIFAVKGATKQQILASFAERVNNSKEDEFAMALDAGLPHLPLPHRRPGRAMTQLIRGQTLSFGKTHHDVTHESKGAVVIGDDGTILWSGPLTLLPRNFQGASDG